MIFLGTAENGPRWRRMPTYQFHIAARKPFHDGDGMELRDAEAAWAEALLLARDVEGALRPGEVWSLDVVEDGEVIFHVGIATTDLRTRSR